MKTLNVKELFVSIGLTWLFHWSIRIRIRMLLEAKNIRIRISRGVPRGMHRMHVHPPSPPSPKHVPERLVMRR